MRRRQGASRKPFWPGIFLCLVSFHPSRAGRPGLGGRTHARHESDITSPTRGGEAEESPYIVTRDITVHQGGNAHRSTLASTVLVQRD